MALQLQRWRGGACLPAGLGLLGLWPTSSNAASPCAQVGNLPPPGWQQSRAVHPTAARNAHSSIFLCKQCWAHYCRLVRPRTKGRAGDRKGALIGPGCMKGHEKAEGTQALASHAKCPWGTPHEPTPEASEPASQPVPVVPMEGSWHSRGGRGGWIRRSPRAGSAESRGVGVGAGRGLAAWGSRVSGAVQVRARPAAATNLSWTCQSGKNGTQQKPGPGPHRSSGQGCQV